MFESDVVSEDLRAWVTTLAELPADPTDAERLDRIRAMEEAKNALCAAQAREAAALDASTRQARADAGVRAAKQGAGVASQVALARRESPNRGAVHLGLAKVLTTEMPHTLHAMTLGILSEWRATLLARETACLSLADRRTVDRIIAGNLERLEAMGDRELVREVQRLAHRLDAEAVVARARKAESERTVTIRPAPDTMTWVTALLPVTQGVAVFAALKREADSRRAEGDPRSRGQVMADTLLERVTGRPAHEPVPVHVGLVMTDRTLLQGDAEPAELLGYGIVPADLARDLAGGAADAETAWLRRLYTAPGTADLVAMDSAATRFPSGMRRWTTLRDHGTCRTPWCDAPIRHHDHATRKADGGPTSTRNSQGLCEACNYAKDAHGWHARPRPGPRHTVETTAPTGHTYRSTAPPLPGARGRATTPMEIYLADLVLAA